MPKTTPLKAVRLFCLEHNNGSRELVRLGDVPPVLHPYRLGRRPTEAEKAGCTTDTPILPVLQAIKQHCHTDCAETPKEARACRNNDCPLWPYRNGKNPARKGIGGNTKFLKAGRNAAVDAVPA